MTTTRGAERRPTITDVAGLAGVSHQTVSRYLRYNGGLRPETMARIEAAIKKLDYRPDLIARSMRTRRTGRVAVLMPTMVFNPSRMLAGAAAAAHALGYVIDVVSAEGGAQARSDRMLELVDSGQVEGVLSFAPVLPSVQERMHTRKGVVISADFDDEMRGIGALANGSPVRQLVGRLAELGHERFFHIAGAEEFASARARRKNYLDAMAEFNVHSIGVFDGDWSGASGVEAIRSLSARDLPVAIIAANDLVAAGAIRGALERGWSVPGSVSITGWDNEPISRYLAPSLTTIDVALEKLGHAAMAKLLADLRDEAPPDHDENLFTVIWRESTAAPDARGRQSS